MLFEGVSCYAFTPMYSPAPNSPTFRIGLPCFLQAIKKHLPDKSFHVGFHARGLRIDIRCGRGGEVMRTQRALWLAGILLPAKAFDSRAQLRCVQGFGQIDFPEILQRRQALHTTRTLQTRNLTHYFEFLLIDTDGQMKIFPLPVACCAKDPAMPLHR